MKLWRCWSKNQRHRTSSARSRSRTHNSCGAVWRLPDRTAQLIPEASQCPILLRDSQLAQPGARLSQVAVSAESQWSARSPSLDAGTGSTAILDTIDLLEADLADMIGSVRLAADTLFHGARASAEAFTAIHVQTETLAGK